MTRQEVSAALRRQVEKHVAFDREEADKQRWMAEFLSGTDRPFDRTLYSPGHITGSAFVVSRDRRKVLLVFHAKLARWLQPGGHGEAGETDAEGVARREAAEEVGLVVPPGTGKLFDLDVHLIPARKQEPEHYHFDMRYLYEAEAGELQEAAEVVETRWFEVEEAERLPIDSGLRRMIRKGAARA